MAGNTTLMASLCGQVQEQGLLVWKNAEYFLGDLTTIDKVSQSMC